MNTRKLTIANAIAFALGFTQILPVLAGNDHSLEGPFGYVNLSEVKSSYAPAAALERLKVEAEARLQLSVFQANEQLEKAKKDGKPQSDIEKLQLDLQHEIKGRQASAAEMIQFQMYSVNQVIGNAVQQAAKEKGVDLVLDLTGVLLGGKKVTENGTDITELVKKKLLAAQTTNETPKPEEKSKTETPQK